MSLRHFTYDSIEAPQSLPDRLTPPRPYHTHFIVAFGVLLVATAFFSFNVLVNSDNATVPAAPIRERRNVRSARFLTKYCHLVDPLCDGYAESLECEECRLRRNPIVNKSDKPWYCKSPYLRERCMGGETLLACLRCGLSEIHGKPLPLDVCATVIDECYFSLRNGMCFQCGFHKGWSSRNRFRLRTGSQVDGLKLPLRVQSTSFGNRSQNSSA